MVEQKKLWRFGFSSRGVVLPTLIALASAALLVEASQSAPNEQCGCQSQPRSFDIAYSSSVKRTCRKCFSFEYDFSSEQNWTARVCVQIVQSYSYLSPLLVVVRQSMSTISFEVPLSLKGDRSYYNEVCRTLCPIAHYEDTASMDGTVQKIVLDFWSKNAFNTDFQYQVEIIKDFLIETSEPIPMNLTVSKPVVLQYQIPADLDSVRIEATSDTLKCMTLSVEDIECPFHDTHQSVRYGGYFQTFTQKAAISIKRQIFEDGLYIVLLMNSNSDQCIGDAEPIKEKFRRMKEHGDKFAEVTVQVTPIPQYTSSSSVIWIPIVVFVSVGFFFWAVFKCCYSSWTPDPPEKLSANADEPGWMTDAEFKKQHLLVSDLVKTPWSSRSYTYAWNLVTIGIFYGLPAIQLVYVSQTYMRQTGDMDKCYYNFLCAHQVGIFNDFNHVASNIGYMVLGIFFIFIVYSRELDDPEFQKLKEAKKKVQRQKREARESQMLEAEKKEMTEQTQKRDGEESQRLSGPEDVAEAVSVPADLQEAVVVYVPVFSETKGLPRRYGLFYAMGWALFMEGLMSATYHVCPKKANFQFDTTFMYVIATICIMKLYYSRHSAITAKAHTFWMMLAYAVFLPLLGMLSPSAFWGIFTFSQFLLVIVLMLYMNFAGRLEFDYSRGCCKWFKIHIPKKTPAAQGVRCTFMALGFLTHILVNAFVGKSKDYNTTVLAFFLVGLLWYTAHYLAIKCYLRKYLHGRVSERLQKKLKEKIGLLPIFFFILSLATGAPGVWYFMHNLAAWEKSPAGSRERNAACLEGWDFYDNHDLWHFLSSFSIFFLYLFLFTVDDDLNDKPISEIIAF